VKRIVVLLALASACGAPSAGSIAQPTVTASLGPVTCTAASPALIARLQGFAPYGSGFRVVRASGFRSPDFPDVWFLGVRFSTTGKPEQTGVWVTTRGFDGSGLLLPVDRVADEHFEGPRAAPGDPQVTASDRAVGPARTCVRQP
jgi:hypothetical protein